MSKQTLGLAVIAQDEVTNIPMALAQFYFAVDDIVVVDGGSSDATVSWAEKLGARVFKRPFNNDFSAQKNFAIEQLATDWIYVHDADERLVPPLLDIIRPLIEDPSSLIDKGILPNSPEEFDCYGIPRKNMIDGLWVPPYPDHQYRLFRNYCRYSGRVHETIINFKNRTEVDFKHNVRDKYARFCIMHYKSSKVQAAHNERYDKIVKGV